MNDEAAGKNDISVFKLWVEYERIAMHFNDLLIRLRTQALAGVAALSTVVGIFAQAKTELPFNWAVASTAFGILATFWTAIWMLDFLYYNRLLEGAVDALLKLENLSINQEKVREINMSTLIEDAVETEKRKLFKIDWRIGLGRWLFYGLVFVVLAALFTYSVYKLWCVPDVV